MSPSAQNWRVDETTRIKASHAGPERDENGLFWPVLDEQNELCFLTNQAGQQGMSSPRRVQGTNGAVSQSEGYSVYAHYAKKTVIRHAQCWAHARRNFFDAGDLDPAQAY